MRRLLGTRADFPAPHEVIVQNDSLHVFRPEFFRGMKIALNLNTTIFPVKESCSIKEWFVLQFGMPSRLMYRHIMCEMILFQTARDSLED